LLLDRSAFADAHEERVDVDDRVDAIERPRLPGARFVEHGVRDARDEVGRYLGAIELVEMPLDVADAHAAGVQSEHLVVEALEAALVLGHQLRLEGARPGAWEPNPPPA